MNPGNYWSIQGLKRSSMSISLHRPQPKPGREVEHILLATTNKWWGSDDTATQPGCFSGQCHVLYAASALIRARGYAISSYETCETPADVPKLSLTFHQDIHLFCPVGSWVPRYFRGRSRALFTKIQYLSTCSIARADTAIEVIKDDIAASFSLCAC